MAESRSGLDGDNDLSLAPADLGNTELGSLSGNSLNDSYRSLLVDLAALVPATGKTYDDFCRESAELGDDLDVISDLGGEYKTDNYGASLTGEWDFSDQLSIKSISAWRFTEATQNDDLDHTGTPFLHRTTSVHPVFDDPRETDQYSQELQFTGSGFDERLQYVSGLYWFREKTDGGDQLSYLGPYEPAIANLFFLNSSNTLLDADNQAIAVFTQAEWEFNEHWRLTAGVRYTDEERKLTRATAFTRSPARVSTTTRPLACSSRITSRPRYPTTMSPRWPASST